MKYTDEEINEIVSKVGEPEMPTFNQSNAWKNIESKTALNNQRRLTYRKMLKYAAVICFGVLLGIIGVKSKYFISEGELVEITASKGEKVDVKLPDGNKIWLNANSSIRYPANFNETNKKIYASGELFFDIADNSTPLIVVVDDIVIIGFESSFNLKTSAITNDAIITVLDGWVSVKTFDESVGDIIVEKGYTAHCSSNLPLFIEEEHNVNITAWKTGDLVFDKTPLSIVAQTLTGYFEVPVSIEGDLKYCNFSSTYKNANLEEILLDIKEIFTVEINGNEGTIRVRGDDC